MLNEQMRSTNWMEYQKNAIGESLEHLLYAWQINKPLEEMLPLEKKKASFVLETVAGAYGINIDDTTKEIIEHGFYPHLDHGLKGKLTINHRSLAASIQGNGIYTPVKYIPVLMGEGGIGTVSPLSVINAEDAHTLQFQTNGFHWNMGIKFVQPPPHATHLFNLDSHEFLGKEYADSCVAGQNGGFVLVDSTLSCAQECNFCDYEQGEVKSGPTQLAEMKQVLEFMAQNTGKITACFSAGSALSADHGVVATFKPMLEVVDEIKQQHPQLKVELEIELMPWQKSENESVLVMLTEYYQKGYIKAVNMNPETPIGIDRSEFMKTKEYGKANIPIIGSSEENQGYLETFQLLKEHFPDLQMAGLILYGLKPKDMDHLTYSQLCLHTIDLFAQNGIKILLQPLKISASSQMADYPLVDPFWLTGSILMADQIHMQHGLHEKPKVGCVNGCDACDPSRSGYSLINYTQKTSGKSGVNELLQPWLSSLNQKL